MRGFLVCVYETPSDEGLAAMSDCQDMTTALARELTQGIKDEVEDLGAVFKRMALLKPVIDGIEGELAADEAASTKATAIRATATAAADTADTVDIDGIADITPTTTQSVADSNSPRKVVQPKQPTQTKRPAPPAGLLSLLHPPKSKRATKKKPASTAENQFTLADFMRDSA